MRIAPGHDAAGMVGILTATLIVTSWPTGLGATPSGAPAKRPSRALRDDPLVDREARRICGEHLGAGKATGAGGDKGLRNTLDQRAFAMAAAGGTLAGLPLLMYLFAASYLGVSVQQTIKCQRQCTDCSACGYILGPGGSIMLALGLPAITMMWIGTPLLVAGVTRNYLSKHPEKADALKRVGSITGYVGLSFIGLSLLTIPMTHTSKHRIAGAMVAPTFGLVGLLVAFSGLAIWNEARRARGIIADHRGGPVPRPHKASDLSMPAFDAHAVARGEASLRAGLPQAQIWAGVIEF